MKTVFGKACITEEEYKAYKEQKLISIPDIDEAAEEWVKSIYGNPGKSAVSISAVYGFKAGAEWMSKKGITVTGDTDDEYCRILEDIKEAICKISPDSNVIVQIRNEYS